MKKLLFVVILTTLSGFADDKKPIHIPVTKEACVLEDGKLKTLNWEDCAYGLLAIAAQLEHQRDEALKPSPKPEVKKP